MIAKGYLDLGFVTLSEEDKTNDEYVHIYYENILCGRFVIMERYPFFL